MACRDGARAARLWLAGHDDRVAVAVVFEPMLDGDDQAGAAAEAARFDDPRVQCFWDGERASGTAWAEQFQGPLIRRIAPALPEDDPWRARAEEWIADPVPVWDAGYFFAPAADWPAGALPEPAAWCIQHGFELAEDGSASGIFWRSASLRAMERSSWREQFAAGMAVAEG